MNPSLSLGEKLRQLREGADLSLRELAKAVNLTPPFLSDVELGRRYPSDSNLLSLAQQLKVPVEELKICDTRESMSDLKRIVESNPSLGFAFRTLVDQVKQGSITPDAAAAKIKSALKE